MSRTSRNFVFAYTFLVILPLAGLVGILRGGHNLKAPVSIDGVWTLRADLVQLASLPCGSFLTANSASFAISQSGKSFAITLPAASKMAGSGALDALAVHASLSPNESSADTHCAPGQKLSLLANIDRRVNASLMTGTLSAADCSSCAFVNFQAERQIAAARQGGE